jgi:hypothetical protein
MNKVAKQLRALMMLAMMCYATSIAYADPFRLRIEELGSGIGVVVTDNGEGDTNSALGVISTSLTFGALLVDVTTGLSNPVLPSPGPLAYAEMDFNSVLVDATVPASFRLSLEDSDFTAGPLGPLMLIGRVGGTLTAAQGSSASFQTWVNPTNLVPDFGVDQATAGLVSPISMPANSVAAFDPAYTVGPGAFSSTSFASFDNLGQYSLFSQAIINFNGPGIASFDLDTQVVPEPSALLLIGSGFSILGIWRLRKRS